MGCAKWVPRPTRSVTARTIAGWPWPASETPYPPWKSEYSVPSTSKIRDPEPWLIHTAWGSAICQLDVAPPARWLRERSISRPLAGCRARKRSDSSRISRSTASSPPAGAAEVEGSGVGVDVGWVAVMRHSFVID